jgi:hypothetical protein
LAAMAVRATHRFALRVSSARFLVQEHFAGAV